MQYIEFNSITNYISLTSTSYPTSLLFPTLPYSISLLPYIFKIIAFIFFLPVLILAGSDVIGWTVFKLILRPLGYASTIRFKDPEPSVLLQPISASSSSSSPKKSRPLSTISKSTSSSEGGSLSPEIITYSGATQKRGELISPTFSQDDEEEEEPLSPTLSESDSLSSHSGTTLHSLSLASSSSSNPNHLEKKNKESKTSRRKRRNRSYSSSSSISSMSRFGRASSVGIEGPMIQPNDDASGESQSPGRSEDEAEEDEEDDYQERRDSDNGSEGEQPVEMLRKRRTGGSSSSKGKAEIPRGGVAFGFTKVGRN